MSWLAVPEFVSAQMRMPLLDGAGLSTQIADLASFFLVLGSCMLLGLSTGNHIWFYPPMMLLGAAAFGRILSWLFHDAALVLDMIAVEVVTILILFGFTQQIASNEKEKIYE